MPQRFRSPSSIGWLPFQDLASYAADLSNPNNALDVRVVEETSQYDIIFYKDSRWSSVVLLVTKPGIAGLITRTQGHTVKDTDLVGSFMVNHVDQSYEVNAVFLRKAFRGMGLGLKMYQHVIARCKILLSGDQQTVDSEKVWMRLAQMGYKVSYRHENLRNGKWHPMKVVNGKWSFDVPKNMTYNKFRSELVYRVLV